MWRCNFRISLLYGPKLCYRLQAVVGFVSGLRNSGWESSQGVSYGHSLLWKQGWSVMNLQCLVCGQEKQPGRAQVYLSILQLLMCLAEPSDFGLTFASK